MRLERDPGLDIVAEDESQLLGSLRSVLYVRRERRVRGEIEAGGWPGEVLGRETGAERLRVDVASEEEGGCVGRGGLDEGEG